MKNTEERANFIRVTSFRCVMCCRLHSPTWAELGEPSFAGMCGDVNVNFAFFRKINSDCLKFLVFSESLLRENEKFSTIKFF